MERQPKLPRIRGGTFNDNDTIDSLQKKIDALPKKTNKPKILFVGEASFLKTGFSTYWDNIIRRLYNTGKYELAELGSYSYTSDPRAKELPWKFYGVMPERNDAHGISEYGNPHGTPEERMRYSENQFGKAKFDPVLADFKADIVIDLRDHWMTHWQKDSVFRDNFHWIWMACVDSYPQKWEWIHDYGQADTLLAYSYFGKRVLETQSRTHIAQDMNLTPLNVKMVCQPGINAEIYKPVDKLAAKQLLNVAPHIQIVGTVMRNQKRKLFPRIIESFRMFKEQNGWLESDHKKKKIPNIDNIKLFLHTSIKDVGFDIPEAVRREGLQSEVVYTYLCTQCGACSLTTFMGHPAQCPQCKQHTFITPNTQIGLPDEQFSKLFNIMDVYVQMSIAEGDGMPVQNAKSAGIPVIMSDYAALHEKAHNGGGIPVKGDLETEAETMQWRHWFNRQDFVDKLTKLFKKKGLAEKIGRAGRRCIEQYYNWDLIAKKWEYILDSIDIKDRSTTWEMPLEVLSMPNEPLHTQAQLTNEEFITQCYLQLLGRQPDEDGYNNWLNNLRQGQSREAIEKFFRGVTNRKNRAAQLLNPTSNPLQTNPIEQIANGMDSTDTFRILYCIPETAGDVLVSTGILTALREKYPHASIYVATNKKYFDILNNNPCVDGVFEFNQALDNYRTSEPFGPSSGFVNLCFCPYIVTQRIPHWIHGGKGESLGVTYAHLCNLSLTNKQIRDNMFIDKQKVEGLPEEFITFHCKTTQDPKDYDNWHVVFDRIKGIPIIQVGDNQEPLLEHPDVVDMRGKTNPQQLAYIISKAKLHVGQDSFPAHVANAVKTLSVIVYGGTYAKQAGLLNTVSIEPDYRSGCVTSCHLIDCLQKKQGGGKCINHILPDTIIDVLSQQLGKEYIVPEKPINISAYCIIKDGNKFQFPYQQCIEHALKVVNEFVMVDGGSTDGTYENLLEMAKKEPRLKVLQHIWNVDDPMLMGNEKTYARQQCSHEYLIQLDADEIITEKEPGQIRKLIRSNPKVPIFDFPVINLYDNDTTIRIDQSIWKWRLSKNLPEIIHGVHGAARDFDPENMSLTYDKTVSDSCEYINRDTLQIFEHSSILAPPVHQLHHNVMGLYSQDKPIPQQLLDQYKIMIEQIAGNMPVIYHYSFRSLQAKIKRAEFWNLTWHGKRNATHNSSEDIKDRLENQKELTIEIQFEHPLKGHSWQ